MKRVLFFFLSICLYVNSAAQNITAMEYFFDADPGAGSGSTVSITAATTISKSFDVSITSLADGFHTLSVRAKDVNNKWSTTFTSPFYKISATSFVSAPNINKLEYFIDGDLGAGLGTDVPITAGTTITNQVVNVSLASVADGFHTITFRARDANGKWSTAFTSPFYKLPASSLSAAPNVNKLEYFIDGDLGAGLGTDVPITAGTTITNQVVNVSLASVADGFHTITFRARDANGKWSTAFTSPFYKLPASSLSAAPNVNKLEYFIDGDLGAGLGTDVPITAGTTITNQVVNVSLASVADGFHTITFRARDANGKWSTAFTSPFYKLPASSLASAPNITRLEYFFDDDAGFGPGVAKNKTVTITPGTSVSLVDLSVDVSTLSTGTHKISFRAQDANGKWSIVHMSTFGVFGPAPTAQPTNLTFSTTTTTSYTVNFTAASPAPDGGYIVIRKAASAPTTDPVDGTTYTKGNALGDGTIAYVGTATTFNETALSSGTQYFYKIYAYNGSTTLTNYLTTTPLQGNTTTLPDPVQITLETFPAAFDKGGTLTVSITVNSAAKASGVVLKYKGISEPSSALKSVTVTNSGNKFEKVIASSDLTDLIGIKYYFEVTDKNQSATAVTSNTGKAYVSYPNSSSDQVIPSLSFGDKLSNYQTIAVPLLLTDKTVSTVFGALGGVDNTQWRLFDYGPKDNGRANREYGTGAFSLIEPGKGYWLIARKSTTINPGEGTAAGSDLLIDENNPFTISLVSGWNLIGNPYNFPISWTEVLTANGNPAGVETSIYRFKNGTLSLGVELGRYQGAFIKSTSNVDIKVPTLRNTSITGGRISSEKIDLLKNQWSIPISVTNGDLTNETSGIGMHPKAKLIDQDDFDRTGVPLLEGLNMPELVFSSTSTTPLTKDVVPTQDHFTWPFTVAYSGDEPLKLQWPAIDKPGEQQLILLDLATQRVIDMTKETEIQLSSACKSLRIIFGDQNYINRVLEKELPAIGIPFPNPAHEEVKIPIFISESLDNANVTVRVYNSLGKEVATLLDDRFSKGYHVLNWKPKEPAGLYIVTLKVGPGAEKRVKLIIQ